MVMLFFIALCSACSGKPYVIKPDIIKSEIKINAVKDKDVYVVSHGWHTGFVISAQDMYKQMPALKLRFPGALYIEFGWGDKGFYQANEITTGLTLRAIFWPTDSVVHAVALPKAHILISPGASLKKFV